MIPYVRLSSTSVKETNFNSKAPGGLKLIGININSIGDTKLYLMAFLEVHKPHVVAVQEIEIEGLVATSELFPETWVMDMHYLVSQSRTKIVHRSTIKRFTLTEPW